MRVGRPSSSSASVVAGIAVGLCLMGAGAVPALRAASAAKAAATPGYLAAPSHAERTDGCSGVRTDPRSAPRQHRFGHIDYPGFPPSSGPHHPDPLPDRHRFYDLDDAAAPERAVHSLEHGYVVVWFDSEASAADVAALRAATDRLPRLLAVGWTRGRFPDGQHVVLTAWERSERCERISDEVLRNFYRVHGDRAPEAGGLGGTNAPARIVAEATAPDERPSA